jgi:hypothetical protein
MVKGGEGWFGIEDGRCREGKKGELEGPGISVFDSIG